MEERWKAVIGYENLYLVSQCGNFLSLPKTYNAGMVGNNWICKRKASLIPTRKKITYGKCGQGYVSLSKDNITTRKAIGSIVLEAFKKPRPKGKIVCFRDGNKKNNYYKNLFWGNRSSVHTKLNEEQQKKILYEFNCRKEFLAIHERFRRKFLIESIAKRVGVQRHIIQNEFYKLRKKR